MFKSRRVKRGNIWSLERSVLTLSLFVTVLSLICFSGNFELYPFAPYSMYSEPFALPYEDFVLEAVMRDNTPRRIVSFNNIDQSFLESIFFPMKDNSQQVNRELDLLYKNCRDASCIILANDGRISLSDIRLIRPLKRVFKTLTALSHQQPEEIVTLGEVRVE